MSVTKADRFLQLKAKVKAEMQRRNQSGSVASYGDSSYDYTVPPAEGKTIRAEHRDKLVEPMRAINSDLVPASVGTVIREDELANMETRVAVWSARSMTDQSGSDCKSGCTGTCYTGCDTGCSGCGSECPNSCGINCDGCLGSCEGHCAGDCGSGCTWCTNACSNGCGDSCSKGCQRTTS